MKIRVGRCEGARNRKLDDGNEAEVLEIGVHQETWLQVTLGERVVTARWRGRIEDWNGIRGRT